jgi:hypothetical protein
MRRWLVSVVLFLLLGAAVNVAVAWGFSLAAPKLLKDSLVEFGQTFGGATFSVWSAHRFDAIGCERIVSMWQQGGPSMPAGQGVIAAEEVLPAWAGAARPGADFPDGAQVGRHVDARGWPMLAVRSSLQFTMPQRASGSPTLQQMVTVSGGFLHPGDRNTPWVRMLDARVLPFVPIWPGFLINTLLYGAVLWLLICGPPALRRSVRLRRGRCPRCGYPAGASSVCTECGRALPASVVRRAGEAVSAPDQVVAPPK